MRVVIVGAAGKKHRTEYYIRTAMQRASHQVFWFNSAKIAGLGDRACSLLLERFCSFIAPDFVLITKASRLDPAFISSLSAKTRTVMWYFDAPPVVSDQVLAIAKAAGTLFITNSGQKEFYRDAGVKTVLFLPQACDSRNHYEKTGPIRYESSFIGSSGNSHFRQETLKQISEIVALHVWGKANRSELGSAMIHRRAVHNRSLLRVIGQSKFIIGMNSHEALNTLSHTTSNRAWLTLGCAGFYLGFRTPGIERIIPEGVCAEFWSDLDELASKISTYKQDNDKRETVRQNGYQWVHRHHTYDNRIVNLFAGREFRIERQAARHAAHRHTKSAGISLSPGISLPPGIV
jgi:spore maturation protein CgeB